MSTLDVDETLAAAVSGLEVRSIYYRQPCHLIACHDGTVDASTPGVRSDQHPAPFFHARASRHQEGKNSHVLSLLRSAALLLLAVYPVKFVHVGLPCSCYKPHKALSAKR